VPFQTKLTKVQSIIEFFDRRLGLQWDNPICNPHQRAVILEAIDHTIRTIAPLLYDPPFGGNCGKLATCLRGKEIGKLGEVSCADCDGNAGGSSKSSNQSMQICGPWAPTPHGLPPPTMAAVQNDANQLVFHELVHLCGGTDLDCYTLQGYFFWRVGGSSPAVVPTKPDVDQWTDICGDPRNVVQSGITYGAFVAWIPAGGEVFARHPTPSAPWATAPVAFIYPNPGWAHTC
jgi:hypothetical protein